MLKAYINIDHIKKKWGDIALSPFLELNFLRGYYNHHLNIKHLFIMGSNIRLYAHIFKLTFNKTKNYANYGLFRNIFLNLISLDVLYLTNSFFTNSSFFITDKQINLRVLLEAVKQHYSMVVIPDFLFQKMKVDDNEYTKIEVEEEMVLEINPKWSNVDDYTSDLRKKYRNKIKKIIKLTSDVEIKLFNSHDVKMYIKEMQELFDQVVESARFNGPNFNVGSFTTFINEGFMKVYGYFLHGNLIGFSSEIEKDELLYSYFVGFDKQKNKDLPIYGRILIENIKHAIQLKKKRLILGRTANEYKSNFGAYPVQSFVYLKVKSKFLNAILKPIYKNSNIKNWKKRSPFKTIVKN